MVTIVIIRHMVTVVIIRHMVTVVIIRHMVTVAIIRLIRHMVTVVIIRHMVTFAIIRHIPRGYQSHSIAIHRFSKSVLDSSCTTLEQSSKFCRSQSTRNKGQHSHCLPSRQKSDRTSQLHFLTCVCDCLLKHFDESSGVGRVRTVPIKRVNVDNRKEGMKSLCVKPTKIFWARS